MLNFFLQPGRLALLAGSAILAVFLWLAITLQPENQLRSSFRELLKNASKKDYEGLREMMADDFRTPNGQDRESALAGIRTVLDQFFILEVTPERLASSTKGRDGTVSARILLRGRGSYLAEMAMQRVNGVDTEFVFAWKRGSWKPWDWKLTTVTHPQFAEYSDYQP